MAGMAGQACVLNKSDTVFLALYLLCLGGFVETGRREEVDEAGWTGLLLEGWVDNRHGVLAWWKKVNSMAAGRESWADICESPT